MTGDSEWSGEPVILPRDFLPLIATEGLLPAQVSGHLCASCRKAWPRPCIPVGRTKDGAVLLCCQGCQLALERVA